MIAVDYDDVTVNVLYRSLRDDGIDNILPLVMNLVDPSPARGWRGSERSAFTDRGAPDLVLALALVHHLAIGSNVPLPEVVSVVRARSAGRSSSSSSSRTTRWRSGCSPTSATGLFPDYRIDAFESELAKHYTIERAVSRCPVASRTLFVAEPR